MWSSLEKCWRNRGQSFTPKPELKPPDKTCLQILWYDLVHSCTSSCSDGYRRWIHARRRLNQKIVKQHEKTAGTIQARFQSSGAVLEVNSMFRPESFHKMVGDTFILRKSIFPLTVHHLGCPMSESILPPYL